MLFHREACTACANRLACDVAFRFAKGTFPPWLYSYVKPRPDARLPISDGSVPRRWCPRVRMPRSFAPLYALRLSDHDCLVAKLVGRLLLSQQLRRVRYRTRVFAASADDSSKDKIKRRMAWRLRLATDRTHRLNDRHDLRWCTRRSLALAAKSAA